MSDPLTAEEKRRLHWLRQALRLHLVRDHMVILPGEDSQFHGDDQFLVRKEEDRWAVSYFERGREAGGRCLFDSVSDLVDFVFWKMTQRSPLNFNLDGVQFKPY